MSTSRTEFGVSNGVMTIPVTLWRPDTSDTPRPLLLVHDGPEYDQRCGLIGKVAGWAADGQISPYTVALLAPDDVDNRYRLMHYGASEEYRHLLAEQLLPEITRRAPTEGPIVGMGASMGALAMLHAADNFDALFLQSASIHHADYGDEANYQASYNEYPQVKEFVEKARHNLTDAKRLHIEMTCGNEPNYEGNKALFYILREQGHTMTGGPVMGGHSYEAWGAAFEPYLRDLLLAATSLRHTTRDSA